MPFGSPQKLLMLILMVVTALAIMLLAQQIGVAGHAPPRADPGSANLYHGFSKKLAAL
jgi:hypothetical protein